MGYKLIGAATLWLAAPLVVAEVEIVDRPVAGYQAPAAATPSYQEDQSSIESQSVESYESQPLGADTKADSGELYYQLQVLQQEVVQLRGLFEEQAYQIKQLKQQRMDDYVDLDRRISQGTATPSAASKPISAGSSNTVDTAVNKEDEYSRYKKAVNLVIRDRDYEQGVVSLQAYLTDYPNGPHASNAQYWLGEVFLAQGDLDGAQQWFDKLLEDFPLSAKVPDAKYKLGTVYHKLGAQLQARSLLEEVAASEGNAAKLASDYLRNNFK